MSIFSTGIVVAFIMAFTVTFCATPFVKKFAFKIGAVDVPTDGRRMHTTPKALLGGLAIFLGFTVAAAFCAVWNKQLIATMCGAVIIVVVGAFDDRYNISAKLKLLFQILAALIPVFAGITIERMTFPTSIIPSGVLEFGIWGAPLTVVWIVAVTNALNLIDGLDGLAVGVASISSMTLLCISIIVAEPFVGTLTACLVGACIGFLPYNFNPAKLFMGDTGALFLGYMLSVLSMMGLYKSYTLVSFAVPLLVLGLPIFDTGAAIIRRAKNRKPIMSADRSHLHHKLVDSGCTHKQAVLIIYAMCILLGMCAIILMASGVIRVWALVLTAAIFIAFAFASPAVVRTFKGKDNNDEKKS
ncbi:MAG: MraY family glycosyltransferase [Clostridia bacterium]|nr:MraY family glycosyltransferase [Clostridia bacterium]